MSSGTSWAREWPAIGVDMVDFIYGDVLARSYRRDRMVVAAHQARIDEARMGRGRPIGAVALIRQLAAALGRIRTWADHGAGDGHMGVERFDQRFPQPILDGSSPRSEVGVLPLTTLVAGATDTAGFAEVEETSLPRA